MRRLLFVVALCSTSCTRGPANWSPDAQPAPLSLLRAAFAQRTAHYANPWDGTLERVELSRFEGENDLYVALCDWDARWWGDFVVFCAVNGELQWTATVSEQEAPGAGYGVSARGFRLPGFSYPLVEVLWSSHMGNGSLYLYEMRKRRLHLLLQTRAVDFHSGDGNLYRGGTLTRSYEDIDGDGFADLTLSGVVDEVTFSERTVLASRPVQETFLWNSVHRVFERPVE